MAGYNRMEFATVRLGSTNGADRVLNYRNTLYVRKKYVTQHCDFPIDEIGAYDPKHVWINWSGNNPYSSDVRTAKPEESGVYQQYLNMAYVLDEDVDRVPCQYYEENGDVDTEAGTVLAYSEFDEIAGNCVLETGSGIRMVYSRGDGVATPDELKSSGGLTNFHKAERNWKHNPTREYREALLVAYQNI